MRADCNDSIVWTKRGVSVVWDAPELAKRCTLAKALSLRQWFRWQAEGWPVRDDYYTGKDGRTIIVAGLDAAIDSMTPETATEWMQAKLLAAIREFQAEVAGGGQEAALIFWMVNRRRFEHRRADDSVIWKSAPGYRGETIPISHCIWNGAQRDIARIVPPGCADLEHGIGLFLQRVS
ncbi:MAG TPA: hypothetical protein VFT72_06120 [Opitutaceae bacterium]|nr:hypothetical protein [Opitutaceae bacterium]